MRDEDFPISRKVWSDGNWIFAQFTMGLAYLPTLGADLAWDVIQLGERATQLLGASAVALGVKAGNWLRN